MFTGMLNKDKDDKLIGRLFNWKFGQATQYLRPDHPEAVHAIVNALASQYGNCGWADGGTSGTIIAFVVGTLIGEDSD